MRTVVLSLAALIPAVGSASPTLLADLPLEPEATNVVHLHVPQATAPEELSLKIKHGAVERVDLRRDGVLILDIRADEDADEVTLKLKAPGAKGSYNLPVAPPASQLALELEPRRLKPGRGGALVKIIGENVPADAQVSVVATAGTLGPMARTADGWLAPWTPPSRVERPTPVLFVASDLSRPRQPGALGVVELSATEQVTVSGPLQGEVTLTIGDRSFGTKQLGHKTSTTFDVARFPSDASAETTASSLDGAEDARTIALPPSGARQVRLEPLLPGIGWPAGEEVEFRLAAVDHDGTPLAEPSRIAINGPSKVAVSPVSDGLFALRFLAPNTTEPWSVTATLDGAMTFAGGRSIPGVPRSEIALGRGPLAAGERGEVVLTARSSQGLAWPGALGVVGQGFALVGEPELSPDGAAVVPIEATGGDAVVACAEPLLTPTGLPAVRVRVWSDQTALDPGQGAMVHAIAEDALGMPVPATVKVSADQGSLLPVTLTDGGHTVARWSGNVTGAVRLTATLGDLSDTAALWVSAGARGAPPVGTGDEAAGELRWRAATPCVY